MAQRFWAKVDKRGPDECWPWTASLRPEGYGNFQFSPAEGKIDAHRAAWRLAEGAVPIGFVVRHRCDNKQCVNPRHLELGTRQQNVRDWVDRGCRRSPPVPSRPRPTVAERFWKKVTRRRGKVCWLWHSGFFKNGYGRFAVSSRNHVLAHRAAWQIERGPIPEGMCVLHACDNPPCVNPAHLWLGTNADNIRDRGAKGRTASGDRSGSRLHPERLARGYDWVPTESRARGRLLVRERYPDIFRGERNGRARLTYAKAAEARRLHADGMAARPLARRFGVGKTTMQHLLAGRTWKV